MERRNFLKASVGAVAASGAASAAEAGEDAQRDLYELRTYNLASKEDRKLVDSYLSEAAIPAYNRQGVKPVGVLEPADGSDPGKLHVLLRYGSLDQLVKVRDALASDEAYHDAASEYLGTPQDDPAYKRIESVLTVAFKGHPRLRVPEQTKQGQPRLFELRTYESHNERKARLKVEMFNKHEMALFDKLGFTAVFYSDKLIGDKLPNLTYMLVYDDKEQRDALWKKFFESEGWDKLSSMERYKNTVSKVHNWFLKPTDYSQL